MHCSEILDNGLPTDGAWAGPRPKTGCLSAFLRSGGSSSALAGKPGHQQFLRGLASAAGFSYRRECLESDAPDHESAGTGVQPSGLVQKSLSRRTAAALWRLRGFLSTLLYQIHRASAIVLSVPR